LKKPDPKKKNAKKPASLRKRAEGVLAKQKERLRELSSTDLKKLVHELGTHQIELEMQNEELRRAQAEIDSSRRKYADLYDFSPMGYFTFDKNGVVREVNHTGAGMLGMEKRSLIARPVQNFMGVDSRETFRVHLTEVFRTPTRQTCELNLRRKNGDLFPAQLQSIGADSGGGAIDSCRTAVSDVSERKQAAEALAAANFENEKITRILESVPDGMAIVNDHHKILMTNYNFRQMTGYTRDELLGRAVEMLVPVEIAAPHVEWRDEYIKNPKARPMGALRNLFCRRKDGTSFPVEISLSPLGTDEGTLVIAAVRDITERLRAQQVVSQLAALVESSDDAIIGKTLDGIIVSWNRGAESIYGYTAQEVVGKPISLLVPPDRADDLPRIIEKLRSGEQIESYETERMRKDGQRIEISVTISPVKDIAGRITGASTIARDITALKKAESLQRLAAAVFANTTEGIVVTDAEGTIQSVNRAFEQITGYSEAEVIAKTPNILQSGLQNADFYDWLWKTLRETGTWKGNFWNRRKNGEIYPQETTINAIKNERGEIAQYCGIFRDVTRQHKLEEALRMLSSTDGLTGLANRRSFDETIEREWRRGQRSGYPLALIIADIDDFKKFNDTYGHLAGDDCLKKVGASIRNAVSRAGDLAARYGGEEFVLLLPMMKATEAEQIAEDMRKSVEALQIPHTTSGAGGVVTLSLGVAAVVPRQDMAPDALIVRADMALYRAKQDGKNCVRSQSEA